MRGEGGARVSVISIGIPAKAGIQALEVSHWVPAFAGTTLQV